MDRVSNIAGAARRRRLLVGIAGALAACAVVWLQQTLDLPRALRLLALPPLLAAAYGFFQYREKT